MEGRKGHVSHETDGLKQQSFIEIAVTETGDADGAGGGQPDIGTGSPGPKVQGILPRRSHFQTPNSHQEEESWGTPTRDILRRVPTR